jgi:hypothetical protein
VQQQRTLVAARFGEDLEEPKRCAAAGSEQVDEQ